MQDGCTVILPTYNEEANIGSMIDTLRGMYPDFRILVMDDNSKDRTQAIVREKASEDDMVAIIVRNPDDRGLSASIFQGIMETQTRFFINMDSDFQHPPSALKGIYQQLLNGSHMSIGVRKDRTNLSSFGRWLGSWGAHFLAAFTLKLHDRQISSDIMSGLFGADTEMCKTVIQEYGHEFQMKGFKALFDLMKYVPKDLRIDEYRFDFGERAGGESKLTGGIVVALLMQCDAWGRFCAHILNKVLD
jgi:dolichol-phosphate mannosyltransferase